MNELNDLLVGIRGTAAEWLRVRWTDLTFGEGQTALLVCVILFGASLVTLLARRLWFGRAGRTHLALPAIPPVVRGSVASSTRHLPFVLFVVGVAFFVVALADPRTSFVREDVTYPGLRIAILIDGSSSMITEFETASLGEQPQRAFYTALAAAERFLKLRRSGPYRDLIALIEFGNQAYVVTPFTTDYENVMISMRLVGSPKNWGRFEDAGTTILQGIEQGIQLFKTFDFLEASGNLMVIFSDGRDDETKVGGFTVLDVMKNARKARIPIYMVRTAFKQKLGAVKEDKIWKPAVEATGGRFYPAADEATLVRAIRDVDRVAAGRIEAPQYTVQRPRYAGYALIATMLWMVAAWLKLGFRHFRTFP